MMLTTSSTVTTSHPTFRVGSSVHPFVHAFTGVSKDVASPLCVSTITQQKQQQKQRSGTSASSSFFRLASSWSSGNDDNDVEDGIQVDLSGRRVRSRGRSVNDDGAFNDDDRSPRSRPMRSEGRRGRNRNWNRDQQDIDAGGWDDFDPWNNDGGRRNDNNDGDGGGWSSRRRSNERPFISRRRPSRNYNDDDGYDYDDDDWGGGTNDRPQQRERRGGGDRRGGFRDRDQVRGDRRPPNRFRDREQGSFRPSSRRNDDGRDGGSFGNRRNRSISNSNRNNRFTKDKPSSTTRAINMNALEGAGFVHLYGLSSVLNALSVDRRDFQTSKENIDTDGWANDDDDDRFSKLSGNDDSFFDDDEEDENTATKHEVKPQAQFRPYLFVQERSTQSGRRGSKASAAAEIIKLAQEKGVPVEYVDKGILNTLSGNRPHQGFVLRCGKLSFESLSKIPIPTVDDSESSSTKSPAIWLVLDEVVDPQNLGALLRSAYFLGGGNKKSLGVLVCSKNSAPPSPVVSAASAGALELLDVYSTSNLPRTLSQAAKDGFRVIGASSSVPAQSQQPSNLERLQVNNDGDSWDDDNEDEIENLSNPDLYAQPPLYDLQDLPVHLTGDAGNDRPILLVLGSEGQGLRTLVAKSCTEFVRIPSGLGPSSVSLGNDENGDDDKTEAGVDSLNVSVSAGIMLWHLLSGQK